MLVKELLDKLKHKGFTHERIGKEVGVHPTTVSSWRSGRRNTNQKHMNMLKALLDDETVVHAEGPVSGAHFNNILRGATGFTLHMSLSASKSVDLVVYGKDGPKKIL